jgi:N-acetylmuramoyl-L-alanine amidase
MKTKSYVMILLGLLLVTGTLATQTFSSAADGPLAGIEVCLDPGHGGSDPGAVNAGFGLEESNINLDVSYGLQWLLEQEGAAVVMTRTGDEYLTNSDRYTFCNAEEATILISVHTNSVVNPEWDGSMTLYAPSRDPDLAQAIHERLYPYLRDTAPEGVEEFRDFGLDHFASGVLFKCDMPAAMMEPLFMSHPAEAALLVQPIFEGSPADGPGPNCASFTCRRGQIARAILEGVLNYYDGGVPPTPEPAGLLQVSAITMWYQQRGGNYFVFSQVAVQDQAGEPVPAAAVELETELPDGSLLFDSTTTGEDGTVVFKLRSGLSGRYTVTVLNVSKKNWDYDPAGSGQLAATLTVH